MASGDYSVLMRLIYVFIFVVGGVYFLSAVFPELSFIRDVFNDPVIGTLLTFIFLFLSLVLVWDIFFR